MISLIGKRLTQLLIVLLPWSVIISVLATERLHFGELRFFKEVLIGIIACLGIWDIYYKKLTVKLDSLDYAIILYTTILIAVTWYQDMPLRSYFYGLRYDVGFLFVLMIARRVIPLWGMSFASLARLFLLSGGLMLAMSILIRFVFGETFLMIFGFSGRVSVWDIAGPPPIYHGIPGAAVVRFQGMLEGPNQMGFFLAAYLATYLAVYFRQKSYRFITICICLILLYLVVETYSRSAYLGVLFGGVSIGVGSLYRILRTRTRRFDWKKITIILIGALCLSVGLLFQFHHKFDALFERHGSTSGHMERMYTGYLRFIEQPWGQGLTQAGPGARSYTIVDQNPIEPETLLPQYKNVFDHLRSQNPDFVFSTETYYIPESWYIQQLIEGGILGCIVFITIGLILLWKMRGYPYFFALCIFMITVNGVLHSFESVHTVFVCFILIASLIPMPPLSPKALSGK